MKSTMDDPSGYLKRLTNVYVYLFRMAYAIIGNRELSEYVLRSAIVEAYLRRREWQNRMGFQEGLEHTVKGVALVELKRMRAAGTFETDWSFPESDLTGKKESAILQTGLAKESEAMKRLCVLYYGCGLTPRQIAQIMKIRAYDVTTRLRRLCSRLLRSARLSAHYDRRTLENNLEKLMLASLYLPGQDIPEMETVFRLFERDVDGATRPRTSVRRIVSTALKAFLVLVLAGIFWLATVILDPSLSTQSPALDDSSRFSYEMYSKNAED